MKQPQINVDFQKMMEIVPSDEVDFSWDAVTSIFPFLAELENSSQDPIHHQEGNVGIHTRMVIEELISSADYRDLGSRDRFKMFWTAVFHDSGKPATREELPGGRITNIGHSRLGAMIAREHLRAKKVPFFLREEICSLIVLHQWPFYLWETNERRSPMQQRKDAIKASLVSDTRHLLMHAMADARGRVSADNAGIIERVGLSGLLFEENGILGKPFEFANNESRVACFDHDDREPDYAAREEYKCHVTVMCGLQGSGKDTWLAANRPARPTVSFDQLRIDMKIDHSDNQGSVAQAAQELAKTYLRAGQNFSWNATNVLPEMRGKVLRLLRAYNAEIEIVYIETLPDTLMKQNANRKAAVPPDAINKLVRKMEPPQPWEAHSIIHVLPDTLTNEFMFESHAILTP
jgi:putative nucleotidyltransferase with HDIG domain